MAVTSHQEPDDTLALLLTAGIGHRLAGRFMEYFGSASEAVEADAARFAGISGLGAARARQIGRALRRTIEEGRVEQEKELMARHGVRLIGVNDAQYPRLLRFIPDPPRVLWVRGELRDDDAVALAIVGARRASHYGREQAERLAALAADAGLTIVSGGAYGVDAAAHRGALKVGGRTIAVIGSGLAEPYPSDHRELFDQIVASGGAMVSELPMLTPPQPKQFPARNRIISGLSLGVVVVEAAKRSGALITARLCVEEHGRECMALPGRVDAKTSEGCHHLIRAGWATLVTNLADVLDCLGETGELLKVGMSEGGAAQASDGQAGAAGESLNDSQRRIVEVLDQPRTLDEVAALSGLAVQQVQSDLTMLEIRGAVARSGGLFRRKR